MSMMTIAGAMTAVACTVVLLKRVCEGLTREQTMTKARVRIANQTPRLGRRQTLLEYDERW